MRLTWTRDGERVSNSTNGRNGRPTLRDIADAVGVSTALVSFAINNRPGVSPDTKARILAEAQRQGYQADPIARSLRTGVSRLYGLVIRNLQNPYFLDVIGGMQDAAAAVGAGVLVLDADYSTEQEAIHVERLASYRLDGLAIAPVGAGTIVGRWQELRPGTPAVIINASVDGYPDVARVSPDNERAVRAATTHLAELGHQRIGFLTAPRELMADHDRLQSFLAITEERRVEPVIVETPLNIPDVHQLVTRRLSEPGAPTAFVTNSDFTAHAIYTAVIDLGLEVGKDVSIVGHDDLPTSRLLHPPLTTMRLDIRAVGRAVFERLTSDAERRVSGSYYEPVELVVRESTGPAPTAVRPA